MQFMGYEGINGRIYPDGSVTPEILKNELKEIGYNTLEPKILNAADYGVPQRRNRAIFIGYREGLKRPEYPAPTFQPDNYITLQQAIGDLIVDETIRSEVNNKPSQYQIESRAGRTPDIDGRTIPTVTPSNTELPNQSEIVRERFSLFNEGETGTALKKRVMDEGIDLSNYPALLKLCADRFDMRTEEVLELFKNSKGTREQVDVLLTKKNIRQRWSPEAPSATIVTVADDYISPWEARTFSVREMARLQSFDDSFEFLGKRTTGGLRRRVEVPQYTQVGNAVPPLMAKAIVDEIIRLL